MRASPLATYRMKCNTKNGTQRHAQNAHATPIPSHLYWVEAMAADGSNGRPTDDKIAQIFSAFTRDVFTPLIALTGVPPAERRKLLAEIRSRLDIVEEVIDTAAGAGAHAQSAGGRAQALNGAAHPAHDLDDDDGTGDRDGGLGRNQRSRVRELVLLEVLGRDSKAVSLQQLMAALAQRGFNDTPSAVVSQLHRLKKLELIRQPAGSTGMYEITNEGLGHGRNLRSSFGPYLPSS